MSSNVPTPTGAASTTSATAPQSSVNVSTSAAASNPASDFQISFVGNSSSTVLFFLALAVGVFIALLFVFFTMRYIVRSKYGLHAYPMTQRSVLFSSPNNIPNLRNQPAISDAELQDQIDYIREHIFTRGDYLDRTIQSRRRNLRGRRRGRFSRMKKLTEPQVQILFPQQTYYKWLNGGQEQDEENRGGVLQEESVSVVRQETATDELTAINTTSGDVIEMSDMSRDLVAASSTEERVIGAPSEKDLAVTELHAVTKTSSLPSTDISQIPPQHNTTDLHFTSGTCAICLEVLEDDSIVRGLVCGHVFHADCLDPWLTKRRACCPMCKRDYYFKDENNNSSNMSANAADGTVADFDAITAPTNAAIDGDGHDEVRVDAGRPASDNDVDSLDLETFRNDPTLRAMLQELVPRHERVRLILSNPQYQCFRFDVTAEEIACAKYGSFIKRFFWRVMGITKDDIYYWAVLSCYRKHRLAHQTTNAESAASNTEVNGSIDDSNGNTRDAIDQRV
ncbi:RING-type domain-containing protein [[Candida] zeylanoides]